MKWQMVGYAILCVITPMAWGLLVVRVSNLVEQRLRAARGPGSLEEMPPIEYHI